VPHVDPGVVDQDVQPTEIGRGLVDHLLDGRGVGQVGAHHRVAVARQPGQHLLRERGRVAVVHRHPVALLGERLRYRAADAPGRPGDEDGTIPPPHFSSHKDSSLVAVAQFLAVAATPFFPGVPTMRNSVMASSLVP
jgi:hypothetical protein